MKQRLNRPESGMSMVETMVALTVGAIILGIAFTQFLEGARINRNQTMITEMRQNSRNIIEMLSRELVPSGFGMSDAPGDAALPIANEPTADTTFSTNAITVRYLANDITSPLTADMSSATADIDLDKTTGFPAATRAMIWDSAGAWEWVTVTTITSTTRLKHSNAFAKPFLQTDDARMGLVKELSYRWVQADRQIQRQEDNGSWVPVAENVIGCIFTYFDEDDNAITPTDPTTRSLIRRIGVDITVRTKEMDRISRRFRIFRVETTLTPRNLAS